VLNEAKPSLVVGKIASCEPFRCLAPIPAAYCRAASCKIAIMRAITSSTVDPGGKMPPARGRAADY
jgi:hypothetical protein